MRSLPTKVDPAAAPAGLGAVDVGGGCCPQVQTLIELRAIHLEERGKMSRYGPLIGLEVLK